APFGSIIRALLGRLLLPFPRFVMHKRIALVAVVVALACSLWAQPSSDQFSQLKYRYIGPVGNRTDSVAGVPGNPNIWYVGAASGGIFKSTDGGVHWEPI